METEHRNLIKQVVEIVRDEQRQQRDPIAVSLLERLINRIRNETGGLVDTNDQVTGSENPEK